MFFPTDDMVVPRMEESNAVKSAVSSGDAAPAAYANFALFSWSFTR